MVTNLDPDGFQVCELSMRPFAVDWLHPDPWPGPVAVRYRNLADGLALARLRRIAEYKQPKPAHVEYVPDAGWHLSWVGTQTDRTIKVRSFSHTDITADLDDCYRNGTHVDGTPLTETDATDLPAWVTANAPKSWWRP